MNTERRWRVEVKWWLSAFVALMAVLLIFSLINVVLSLATIKADDLARAGITDPYGKAIGQAIQWSIAVLFALGGYLFAAALSFRLLVPMFSGAPPRAVAVVLTTWPIALGASLIGGNTLFFAAVGAAFGLAMPLPKTTLLSGDPIKGGAIVGLGFSSFAGLLPMEFAIAWCVFRLWRGNSSEAAATAICAALMPALFLGTQLPHATLSGNALYVIAEVMILGVLALIGFIRSMLWLEDADSEEDAQEEPADMIEATQN
jgi:hypothetical protein